MGNYIKIDKKENIEHVFKESWKYKGDIYQIINNEYINQKQYIKIIHSLTGNIYIKERGEKKEIYIQGKKKDDGKKYTFSGEEKSQPKDSNNEEKLNFIIRKEKEFHLNNIEITKFNRGIGKLIGKNIFIIKENGARNGPFLLDLYLSEHKEYTHSQQPYVGKIKTSNLELSKLINQDNPENILMNSLCGMKNLINTCYINSSLQILIHIPKFIKIILKHNDFQNNVIKEINDIFGKILKQYKEYRPIINPKSFVNYFKSNHNMYNNYSQMDSEMFLEELIWDINIELGNLCEERTNKLFTNGKKNEKEVNFLNYIKESETETHFEINDLFYVYFIHKKKCLNCGYLTYYFDESPGLKLNFEHTKCESKIDLVSLIIDNFKKPITIKSLILCQNCQKCLYVEETTRIAKLPEILILSLQKVNKENTKKIPWLVEFKEIIGIREIVDIDLINESCLYEIFAINNHLGTTPKSGHYFSQIYLKNLNSWFSFNDEYVDNESDGSDPKLSNYILFYKQIIK